MAFQLRTIGFDGLANIAWLFQAEPLGEVANAGDAVFSETTD
jgi:hypothetical protein